MVTGIREEEEVSSISAMDSDGDRSDPIVFQYLSENRGRAAVRGAFWSALNTLIPTSLTALVFVVTSRYLSPSDFGLVALATSIVLFASGFGPTAFGEALIQQQVIRRSHLDTVFWLALGSAALIYAGMLVASPFLASAMGQVDIVALVSIIGLKLFFDLAAMVPNALISRTMSFHWATVRTAIATVISSIVALGLIVAGYGLWAIAIAQIASAVASCLAAFWGAHWRPGLNIRRASLRDLAHYGIFASANRFLQTMNLDQMIIGTLVNPAALGIYNFARRLLQMLNDTVSGGLTSVTHVLLSSLQGDQARVRQAFMLATFGCSLVAFPAFIGLAAVAPDAIPVIFGPQWGEAIWPVRFFSVIGVMGSIGVIQASLINSQGKAQWWFYYQLVRNIITIATVIALYRIGVSYIVFAIMVQVVLLWPVTVLMASRLIGLRALEYFGQFLRPLAAAVAMVACVLGVEMMMADQRAVSRLAAEVVAGALAYGMIVSVLCKREVLTLWNAVSARKASA